MLLTVQSLPRRLLTQCLHQLRPAVEVIHRASRSPPNSLSHLHLSSSDPPQRLVTRIEPLVQADSLHLVSHTELLVWSNAHCSRLLTCPLQLKSRAQCPYQQQRPLRRSIRSIQWILTHAQDIHSAWRHTFGCFCVYSSAAPTCLRRRRRHACRRAGL
jgi:hypothetical protein